jgi:hypothetical protein
MPIKIIPPSRWDRAAEAFPALLAQDSPEFLRLVAEMLECPWAVFWRYGANTFEPAVSWQAPDLSAQGLPPQTQKPVSGGPCGSVWLHAGPRWSRDAVADACMPRSVQADAAGLKMGLWFALGAAPAITGVVELRARRLDRIDDRGMHLFERFGRRLPRPASGRKGA